MSAIASASVFSPGAMARARADVPISALNGCRIPVVGQATPIGRRSPLAQAVSTATQSSTLANLQRPISSRSDGSRPMLFNLARLQVQLTCSELSPVSRRSACAVGSGTLAGNLAAHQSSRAEGSVETARLMESELFWPIHPRERHRGSVRNEDLTENGGSFRPLYAADRAPRGWA